MGQNIDKIFSFLSKLKNKETTNSNQLLFVDIKCGLRALQDGVNIPQGRAVHEAEGGDDFQEENSGCSCLPKFSPSFKIDVPVCRLTMSVPSRWQVIFLINDPKADMMLCPFGAPAERGAGGGRGPAALISSQATALGTGGEAWLAEQRTVKERSSVLLNRKQAER